MSMPNLAPRPEAEVRLNGPAFLMCSPELYEVNYVINPWMEGNVHASSQREARAQWNSYGRPFHDSHASKSWARSPARPTWCSPPMPVWYATVLWH